jgi:hypothetical protein
VGTTYNGTVTLYKIISGIVALTRAKESATLRGEIKEIKNPNTKKSSGSMINVLVNTEKSVA